MVRSWNIGTSGSCSTQAGRTVRQVTLIDVHTSSRDVGRVIRESLITHAGRLSTVMNLAVGVWTTCDPGTRGLATGERVTDHALLTLTRVASLRVGTLAVGSAGRLVQALIDVLAFGRERGFDLLETGQALALVPAFTVVAARVETTYVLSQALVHVCCCFVQKVDRSPS